MRPLLLAAAALLGAAGPAAAQAPRPWALKATPQHLVLSGYWLEAERPRPAHPGRSLTLAPQVYYGPAGHPDALRSAADLSRNATVRGLGLQVQWRRYLRPPAAGAVPSGLYLGAGPQVQAFRLRFEHLEWHEEPGPYGVPYLEYGAQPRAETVLRYGVAAQLGYQWRLGCRALLDVYAGVGVRKAHFWSDFEASQFQSGFSDYAHEGVYVPAGFKLGVVL